MRIWVYSPFPILCEALGTLVSSMGHEVMSTSDRADVAVTDLRGASSLPELPLCPTVALVDSEAEVKEVVRQGYQGYLLPNDGRDTLEQALKVVANGGSWPP